MRLYVYLCFFLIFSTLARGQARIITIEHDKIPGQITATTAQFIRFINRFTTEPDSIPTALVQEIQYEDSLRVIVLPASRRNKLTDISAADFIEAVDLNDYRLLLQSKTVRYDLDFSPAPGKRQPLQLTPASKVRLARWAQIFKAHPNDSFTITAFTTQNVANAIYQAYAVRDYLLSRSIPASRLTAVSQADPDRIQHSSARNRRIGFSCHAVKDVSVLYAEPYTGPWPILSAPSRNPVPDPFTVMSAAQPKPVPKRTGPRVFRRYSVGGYWEGLYTFQSFSGDWINPDIGPGNLQGFGGGLTYTYYKKPRMNLIAQVGYSFWAISRHYLNESGTIAFTNEQLLSRISVQAGARLYAKTRPSLYFQPMMGVQQLSLTSQNSDLHPLGVNKQITKAFYPSFGGLVGYEIRRQPMLYDVAFQYYMIPNKLFVGVTQPLHFFGIRLGIGYRPEKE